MNTPDQINQVIQNRRSVFPPMYTDQPIDRSILEQLLENANWAPTHRMTEPWRFKVLRNNAKQRLGQFLAEYYRSNTPPEKYSDMKYNKTLKKAAKSDTIIAICMQRDPEERLPEWEEIASVACAVQNLWLTATAYGLGGYWSSPAAIAEAGKVLNLAEGERCLGFFYLGHYENPGLEGNRETIEKKVEWLEE